MSAEIMFSDEAMVNFEKQTDVLEEVCPKKPHLDDPQCQECYQKVSKYNCPKCGTRTCSLECCRDHKENKKCDGVRPKWTPVPYHSATSYNGKNLAQDKHFIHTIKHALNNLSHLSLPQSILSCLSGQRTDGEERAEPSDDLDHLLSAAVDADEKSSQKSDVMKHRTGVVPNLAPMERILLSNATTRRIWLTVKNREDSDGSHYDIHADTIFWTVTLKFIRDAAAGVKTIQEEPLGCPSVTSAIENGEATDEGEISADELDEQSLSTVEEQVSQEPQLSLAIEANKVVEESVYTVKKIPETLTVSTLLRQFLQPKENGPLISKADLCMDKMQAFSEAGADKLMLYMKVPNGEKERYYIVDPSKSLLENLRNRFVAGHPVLLVTMSNEFEKFVVISDAEAQELRENRQMETRLQNKSRSFSGNQRGSNNRGGQRGWNRNGRGGQNGHRNHQNYNGQHRAQAQDSSVVTQPEVLRPHSTPLGVVATTDSGLAQSSHVHTQNFRRGSSSGGNHPCLQQRNNFNGGRGGCNQWQQNSGGRGDFNGRGFARRDNISGRKRCYNDLDNTEESSNNSPGGSQQRHWGTNQVEAFRSPSRQSSRGQTLPSDSSRQPGKSGGNKNYLQVLSAEYGSP